MVVVSHGGIINALYNRATGMGFRGKIVNASLSKIFIRPSEQGERGSDTREWELLEWNLTSHLQDAGYSTDIVFIEERTTSLAAPDAQLLNR